MEVTDSDNTFDNERRHTAIRTGCKTNAQEVSNFSLASV
jgi:hypothetical protein